MTHPRKSKRFTLMMRGTPSRSTAVSTSPRAPPRGNGGRIHPAILAWPPTPRAGRLGDPSPGGAAAHVIPRPPSASASRLRVASPTKTPPARGPTSPRVGRAAR
eukprot:5853703-Pyramimonas_sp.AAC.1